MSTSFGSVEILDRPTLLETVEQAQFETEIILANTSFSQMLPTLQLAWDSTSLGALKTCPRYYQYAILQGHVGRAENVHLKFGILLHKAHELYDWLMIEPNADHDAAVLKVVRYLFAATFDFKAKRPWFSDMPEKNRETLIRTVIWDLEQFRDDPVKTLRLRPTEKFPNGRPAVEMPFRFEPGINSLETEEPFLVCGHLDRMGEWMGRVWTLDYKTTRYALDDTYFAKYSPDNQMTIYYAAGQVIYTEKPISGIIIDAAQIGATFSRFQRQPISRTPAQLEEWLTDLHYWLRLAEGFAKANYWPQNDKNCGNYGGCPYRAACGETPEQRPRILNTLYERRIWDPLQVREL